MKKVSVDTGKISGIIFDLDGTLIDSMPLWHTCGYRFLKKQGIEAPRDIGSLFFSMTPIMVANYMIDTFGVPLEVDDIICGLRDEMRLGYETGFSLKKGVIPLLDKLKEKQVPMVILTSTDYELASIGVKRSGLDGYFSHILTSDSIGFSKRDTKAFYHAISKLGIEPDEESKLDDIWVFEDGLYAVKVADSLGMTTVGIYDPVSESEQAELKQVSSIYVHSLEELEAL